MSIDKYIFGYLPSLVWGKLYTHWAVQELFHFAYFCYYPMIAGIPIYLYFTKKEAFKEVIFNLTFVFYCCYTIYSILPVIGGRYLPEAMALTIQFVAVNLLILWYSSFALTNPFGRCFSHQHVILPIAIV
jgi:hypothetical protein